MVSLNVGPIKNVPILSHFLLLIIINRLLFNSQVYCNTSPCLYPPEQARHIDYPIPGLNFDKPVPFLQQADM